MLNHVITDDSLAVFKLAKAQIVSVRDLIVRAVRIQNTIVERFILSILNLKLSLISTNLTKFDISADFIFLWFFFSQQQLLLFLSSFYICMVYTFTYITSMMSLETGLGKIQSVSVLLIAVSLGIHNLILINC